MKAEDFLRAFAEMSADDQQAVRSRILSSGSEESCCSGAMKEHVTGMMKKMEASEDPMAMCQEMMRMCMEKMTTSASSGCSPD